MQKQISSQPRPEIPYEHPDLAMYLHLAKEGLTRRIKRKRPYSQHDASIEALFQSQNQNLQSLCDILLRYVAGGFNHYACWDHTHAYYPGRPSQQSARIDAMEGCSRMLPTLAAGLHSRGTQEPNLLPDLDQNPLDIAAILRSAFLAGTDPNHKGYWGKIQNYDQRICESADLALALWLSRHHVWNRLSTEQQRQISQWFRQVNHSQTVDNNWHLFILTVQTVLKALTGENAVNLEKYHRIKEFYVGDGWFRDGARGNYDYYNAWGFHYGLYWLNQIDPNFDRDFIHQSLSDFVDNYRYFFTPKGLPLFGRSACYRLAASAPLLAAASQGSSSIEIGEAKRAFESNLRYFIAHGALRNGAPTQGVFGDDGRLVDNYSGPASSLWSPRALNIALYSGDRCGLWEQPEQPLPIEQSDFCFDIAPIDAKVIGCQKTQEVTVIFTADYTEQQSPLTRRLEQQTWQHKLAERLTARACRPKNNLLRKGITCYSSKMAHFF